MSESDEDLDRLESQLVVNQDYVAQSDDDSSPVIVRDPNLFYPEISPENDLKAEYPSNNEFQEAFKRYQKETFQTFIKERTDWLPKDHPQYAKFVYKRVDYACVHYKDYDQKGTGERPFQHSRRTGCTSAVLFSAHRKLGVIKITKNVGHNHPLTEVRWKNLPENRKLDEAQRKDVVSLQKSLVPTRAIIREIQKKTGKTVLAQDVRNIRAKTDAEHRDGRTEEQMLDFILSEIRHKDKTAFVEVILSDGEPQQILAIVLATTAMKMNFTASPTVLFLDGTYRINAENYCLYAAVVQDRHGKGRPVFLGFLSSEKAANIDAFFEAFKRCHTEWMRVQVIFVDKDFGEIAGIRRAFLRIFILICTWHALTYMRKQFTKAYGSLRAAAYIKFYDALYAHTEEDFQVQWDAMMDIVPENLREYMTVNWYNCREMWAHAFRREQLLAGANTNNYVEAFFRTVKMAIEYVRKSKPHISECVETVVEFATESVQVADYTEYIHETTELKVHIPEYKELFDRLGQALNDFAVRLLYRQVQILQNAEYEIYDFGNGMYTVTNTRTGQVFAVSGEDILECDCPFACSFGITCRHCMAVHRLFGQDLVNLHECIARYSRHLKDVEPLFRGAVSHQHLFETDEDTTKKPADQRQRWQICGEILKPLRSRMADLRPAVFEVESVRLRQVVEEFVASLETILAPEEDFDLPVVPPLVPAVLPLVVPTAPVENSTEQPEALVFGTARLVNVNRPRGRPTESGNMRNVRFNNTISSQVASSQQPKSTTQAGTRKRPSAGAAGKVSSNGPVPKRRTIAAPPPQRAPPVLLKDILRTAGDVRGKAPLFVSDLTEVRTASKAVLDRTLGAFSVICDRHSGGRFTGFADPSSIAYCTPGSNVIGLIRQEIANGLPCLQILAASYHYIFTHKESDGWDVLVYNSSGPFLSELMKIQLYIIYARRNEPVVVHFVPVQRQPRGSELCGPLAASYMAEIVGGETPENAIFVKEMQQREWFANVLETENFLVCPKRTGRKPQNETTDEGEPLLITFEDVLKLTAGFSKPPNARLAGWNDGTPHRTLLTQFTNN